MKAFTYFGYIKEEFEMKKNRIAIVLFIIIAVCLTFAETVELRVNAETLTGDPVAYRIYMYEALELIPEDFDANWDSLRVFDAEENEIPYQIDDLDGNGKLSAHDMLSFFMTGTAKMVISDDLSLDRPEYDAVLSVNEVDGEFIVTGGELDAEVKIDNHGFANYVNYRNFEEAVYTELGIMRIAGWKGSTFWADGQLGNKHEEKTSYNFKVNEMEFVNSGPVGATFVSDLESETFIGVHQILITQVMANGECFVESNIIFETYTDLMKLQEMSTKALTSVDMETLKHIMPLPRRLVWAEQLNSSSFDYWNDREAIEIVNGQPYVCFDALDAMKPLWWGATYIYSSPESWRGNYSEDLGACAYSISVEKPLVYANFNDFVMGNTWVYESREFRDGLFRWMPAEFNAFETTEGNVSTDTVDCVAHFFPGDNVVFRKVYGFTDGFANTADAIGYLEARAVEIESITLAE